ncbi:unnamed protein product [Zymoseptoria tritici ST99CH_3D1]|nr:unnamed protein product [Zymoseptoria tritici ST99CH_3D1]
MPRTTAPKSSTARPAERASESGANDKGEEQDPDEEEDEQDQEEEEEEDPDEEEEDHDEEEEKEHKRGIKAREAYRHLLRLLDHDPTEPDAASSDSGDDTLSLRRPSADGSCRDALKVFRKWWWLRADVKDTPTCFWASSGVLGELPAAKAQALEDLVVEQVSTRVQICHRKFAKTMGWKHHSMLNVYALFGAEMCQSRKFMEGIQRLMGVSSSHEAAMALLRDASRARRTKKYTKRRVSPKDEWAAIDTDLAYKVATDKESDSDGCDNSGLDDTEEGGEKLQDEEEEQSEHQEDEEIDDTDGSSMETDQHASNSRTSRSRSGSASPSFAYTKSRSRAVPNNESPFPDQNEMTTPRADDGGDDSEASPLENSPEQGHGARGAGNALVDDASFDLN